MCQDDCDLLVSKLPDFQAVFESYQYIPEETYRSILDSNDRVDNCPFKSGKPLITNQQRCLILRESSYYEHVLMLRKDVASRKCNIMWTTERETAEQLVGESSNVTFPKQRRGGYKKCSNPSCFADEPAPNSVWTRYQAKGCRVYSCGNDECNEVLLNHQARRHQIIA